MKNITNLLIITLSLSVILSCKDDDPAPPKKLNPFTDSRDGQVYGTVTIGNQVWMNENLNYYPGPTGGLYYDNDSVKNHIYGRLYLWETIMNGEDPSTAAPSGVRGLCPEGWHFPSIAEWDTLANYLEDHDLDGPDLMEKELWIPSGVATNSTGFSARPAGTMWDTMGPGSEAKSSDNLNERTRFISSTGTGVNAEGMSLESNGDFYKNTNLWIYNYWSCRCVKDE